MSSTILVTGASSGIGKAAALHFHDRGWNVVATMRNLSDGADLQDRDNMLVCYLDVTELSSIDRAIAESIDCFGAIDVLVNNAGYGAYGPLEAIPMDELRRQFDTNVIGPLAVTKAVVPHMRARKSGLIVNVGSIAGRLSMPLTSLYHGTKYAMEGYSESLRYELEPCGIRIKVIEPGFVKTKFRASVVFSNDETLVDYQPLVQAVLASRKRVAASDAVLEAQDVVGVIWKAVTDGTTQLRYPVGAFAEEILAQRAAEDDETFYNSIKTQMDL